MILFNTVTAQGPCTTLGQTPSTAFPVCGSNVFSQAVVPICGNTPVPGACTGVIITDKNPFWYKFKCYSSGTLGFLITPLNLADDYDWQLFDVTNHNPGDVYTDPSLGVAHNWSGEVGLTGASSSGTLLFVCDGLGQPLFSKMPTLSLGHEYLLLISHFSDTQSGYNLSFGGGSALITDTVPPALQFVSARCDARRVFVKLNKRMKCSSLDPNGSDFSITPASAPIVSAVGESCSTGFDFDSLLLTFGSSLPIDNYILKVQNGGDGNTILDNCDNSLPIDQALPFTISPTTPTPLDSISPVGCRPSVLHVVFSRPVICSSVAPDGSDFSLTGPSGVAVLSATASCNSEGLSNIIDITLTSAIVTGGMYQLSINIGTDGNTITNECGLQTPAGSALTFGVKDTVSASFTFQQNNGCHFDSLHLFGNGSNGIISWLWVRDNINVSALQNPTILVGASGQHIVKLMVSNGGCSDSTSQTFNFNNEVKAAFELSDIICPEDSAIIKNTSAGAVTLWAWDFGDGTSSTQKDPLFHLYPLARKETYYTIRLTASNATCRDAVTKKVRVLPNCYIAVPNAFTPNGDGINDYLYPLNAFKAVGLDFKVFNRWGVRVFYTTDWTKKWDGRVGQEPQDPGIYVWTLTYTDRATGVKHISKGTTVLIR